jgi:hypothetical protein
LGRRFSVSFKGHPELINKRKSIAYPQEVFLFKILHSTSLIKKLVLASKEAAKRNLETLPKIIIKLSEHQINQSEKSMFSTLISLKEPEAQKNNRLELNSKNLNLKSPNFCMRANIEGLNLNPRY